MNTFHLLQVICVLAITLVSAIIDVRQRRIPNLLTAPFLLAGILFHLTASGRFGYGPLVDGVLGMLVATLILGCMWVAGGTGAGDVKLMMGLGMWVGLQTVLYVMLGSLVTSLCLLLAVIGLRKIGINTGIELSPTGPSAQPAGTPEKKAAMKRGIPYALGVCLATWLLIGGQLVLSLNQSPPAPAASSPAVPEATTAAASLPASAR